MTLKRIATILALMLAMAPIAQAQDADHRAAAEALFDVLDMGAQLEQSIDQNLDIQIRTNPALEPFRGTMKAFFDKHMSYETLREPLLKIYTDTFTESELDALADFYDTPLGQKAMEKMPEMYEKGAQIGMTRVQENMGELQEMIAAKAASLEEEAALESEQAE